MRITNGAKRPNRRFCVRLFCRDRSHPQSHGDDDAFPLLLNLQTELVQSENHETCVALYGIG
jgi:hypothetical protein